MPKQIIIAEQHRIAAIFGEDQIEEIIVSQGTHQVGDIYLGTVENILTSIDAAFVNLGNTEKNGFIHLSDLGPLRSKRTGTVITELLSPQQKVLVQVMKEPTGNKGPRLTGNVSLPGRYVVLIPFGRGVNLSRRILKENERNRLRALGVLIKPPGMGMLVRTEAEGISEELIIEDLENLQRQWEAIQQEYLNARGPSLLDRERDFITRVLRDLYSGDVNRVVVDTADGLRRIRLQLQSWGDGKIPPSLAIDHHQEPSSIMEYYRVNAAIREALRPRVDLPSGGYIIIEPTEALTVIDVNSGSFTKSRTSRETVLWTNFEASAEIARQLRLRNIAGVIVVDFIDMETREDQLQLLEHFTRSLCSDKSRPQIAQLTELGLVELTRKRQGQSLYEMFGQHCPHCSGLGILANLPGEGMDEFPLVISSQRGLLESSDPFPDERDRPLSGGTDKNIMHHANYQERSSKQRRRPKREFPTPEPRTETRVIGLPTPKLPPLPIVEPKVEEFEPIPEQVVAEKTPRRELPAPRSKPEPPEPAEVVVVTMTALEQEVYSFMGISPMVLVNREGKEARNTIVRIALPGQEMEMIAPVTIEESKSQEVEEFPEQIEKFEPEPPEIIEPPSPKIVLPKKIESEPVSNGKAIEVIPIAEALPIEVPIPEPIPTSPLASRRKRTSAIATE